MGNMTTQSVVPHANVTLLRDIFDAFNAGDIDSCVARRTPAS
jgi:hypothetical protein